MLRIAIIYLVSLSFGAAAADPLELRGEASRGDTIVHKFDHDGGKYEFRLAPIGGGWTIWVGDPMQRDRNYVSVATPPYRGTNPAVIQGWHFRNKDNTGPNAPGAGNVNAPQKQRHFSFVLDAAGYQGAREALEILLWPGERPEEMIKAAEDQLATIPLGNGVMWIEAVELGNLVEGEQAHIERIAFRVVLTLP